jgi:hypothetical protein
MSRERSRGDVVSICFLFFSMPRHSEIRMRDIWAPLPRYIAHEPLIKPSISKNDLFEVRVGLEHESSLYNVSVAEHCGRYITLQSDRKLAGCYHLGVRRVPTSCTVSRRRIMTTN